MKLLKTTASYYNEILKLSKSKPTFFYIATFNMNVDDKVKSIFKNLPIKCDVKLLIGVGDASDRQVAFYKSTFSNVQLKLLRNSHLKIVITNNEVIIGGRNITNSDWVDLSVTFTSKNTISQIKSEFLSNFKKKGI